MNKSALTLCALEPGGQSVSYEVPEALTGQAFAIAELEQAAGEWPLPAIIATQIARLIRKPILGAGRKYFLKREAGA